MTVAPLLIGEKVRLTAITQADIAILTDWYGSAEFIRLYDSSPAYPHTLEESEKWVDEQRKKAGNTYMFAVRPPDSGDLIGYGEISDIQWTHGAAWVSIAIGSPANRGKGYGYDAMRLLLDFAFRELNLHRIQLTVFGYNQHAIALYEKLGFMREGAFREFLHRDGQRYDMFLYGILRREWEARGNDPAT